MLAFTDVWFKVSFKGLAGPRVVGDHVCCTALKSLATVVFVKGLEQGVFCPMARKICFIYIIG